MAGSFLIACIIRANLVFLKPENASLVLIHSILCTALTLSAPAPVSTPVFILLFVSLLLSSYFHFVNSHLCSRLLRECFSSIFQQKLLKVSILGCFHGKGTVFHCLNVRLV